MEMLKRKNNDWFKTYTMEEDGLQALYSGL